VLPDKVRHAKSERKRWRNNKPANPFSITQPHLLAPLGPRQYKSPARRSLKKKKKERKKFINYAVLEEF
jgi:hypothetical protein